MPDEDKNFGGALVLDFRKRWRHVKTIYISLFWELRDKGNLKNLQFWPKASEPFSNIDISNVAYSKKKWTGSVAD